MISNHLQKTLAQVRELHKKVVESQRFQGYSGRARALGGTVALLGAWGLFLFAPEDIRIHLKGWGAVFVISLCLNYGALLLWYRAEPSTTRDIRQLLPAMDPLFPLIVAGILTWIMVQHDLYHTLFGLWMCMYGLVNLASRRVLPRLIFLIGFYYILAGIFCLVLFETSFLNPWPMGCVFFTGEAISGYVLYTMNKSNGSFRQFIGL